MKFSNFYLTILLVLAGIIAGQAQELAWQYSYNQNTDDGSGKPFFVLNLNPEYAVAKARKGEAVSVIGAIIEPEKKSYMLLFTQVARMPDSTVTQAILKIDGQRLVFPKIRKSEDATVGGMRRQMLGITIDEAIFDKLRSAKAASVSVGKTSYALTRDDFNALAYLEMRIKGRELPLQYMLYRDLDETTNLLYVTLNIDPEFAVSEARAGKNVTALGMVNTPSLKTHQLLLYYFGTERDFGETFSLIVDGEKLTQGGIVPVNERKAEKILLRAWRMDIDEAIFNKLAAARSAAIKIGDFAYDLSKDNLAAFGYTKKRLVNYQLIAAPRVF